MMRPKSWLPGVFVKPKNLHSLDHLKYLYAVLCKHPTVTESNRSLLVESMRSISEILIWGDQNDSTVFDFFLEKNMLSFFLSYLQQRHGRYICVQILQTLNILFENIRNETSLYYLLSNNHINAIIVHKFDFSDEEVMAYFISFLKTLSLKLNKHTIHFFYNEHTNDFALYTEAIKFFNHSESMVRIAVRTITLNVYKVGDKAMLHYIRDKTAAPYFFNLVWFIGVHVLDLDCCVRNDADHMSRYRLEDLVAEHLDHLHYLNDILCINNDALNDILTEHMLNKLLIPLYVYSLSKYNTRARDLNERKHVSSVLALFLLSQVFLIISHAPLVRQLAEVIFHGNVDQDTFNHTDSFPLARIRAFTAPKETLAVSLASYSKRPLTSQPPGGEDVKAGNSQFYMPSPPQGAHDSPKDQSNGQTEPETTHTEESPEQATVQNITDEEKISHSQHMPTVDQQQMELILANRPFLESIFMALECSVNDYETLFSLCLIFAMGNNAGINQGLLDSVSMPTDRSETKDNYNVVLIEKLILIITATCQCGSMVRLVTLELSIKLLKQLVYKSGHSYLQDRHLAAIEHARESCTQLLRNFYKTEEIFLDMFEDEYYEKQTRPLNVEFLMMDASLLLAPTGTPLTGIDFNKRLPCGDAERARRAIRVFFLLRDLSLTLLNENETSLPLSKEDKFVKNDDVLDLNNSDLIACTVTTRESRRPERRFLVIDCHQLILVEPDTKRLGWGVVRFVGLLQDVLVSGDKDDSRCLHATIHKPVRSKHSNPYPLLSAKFIFDDHIRCMAAKQRLTKGHTKARSQKIQLIEKLLDVYDNTPGSHYPSAGAGAGIPGRGHPVRPRSSHVTVQNSPLRESSSQQSQLSRSDNARPSTSERNQYVINMCQLRPNERPADLKLTTNLSTSSSLGNKLKYDDKIKGMTDDLKEKINIKTDLSKVESDSVDKASRNLNESFCRENEMIKKVNSIEQQEIQMKNLVKEVSGASSKSGHLSVSFATSRLRSHSHSPKRIPASHAGKARSKSTCGTQRTSAKRHAADVTDTATQTKTSLVPPQCKPGPKSLQPADVPCASLLQETEKGVASIQAADSPKLIPPIETESVRSLRDSRRAGQAKDNGKSMKSQITELAQMVQRHYNYDNDGD